VAVRHPVAHRILGAILKGGPEAEPAFRRLKSSFPEADSLPGAERAAHAIYHALLSGGLTDLPGLDLRTGGRHHEAAEQLIEGAPEGPCGPLLDELDKEARRRSLMVATTRATTKLMEGDDPDEVYAGLVQCVQPGAKNNDGLASRVDVAASEYIHSSSVGVELESGLSALDAIHTMRRGLLTVVAAPTSHGKTSWAIRMTLRAAQRGLKVAYLCLEDYASMPYKLSSQRYGVPLEHYVRPWACTDGERARALNCLTMMKEYDGRVDILPDATLPRFEAAAKGADLVICDYIQKYIERFGGDKSRREAAGRLTSDFQDIVKRTNSLGILCSQVSRRQRPGQGSGPPRRPDLYDLKESGDIENFADAVLILYWPWFENKTGQLERGNYEIVVAKDKMGPCGVVSCSFDGSTQTWRDLFSGAR